MVALKSIVCRCCGVIQASRICTGPLLAGMNGGNAGTGAADTETQAEAAAATAAARSGLTIAISNEVGLGLVPDNPLGRSYRDLLGRVNTLWADAAERAYLLVAGRPLLLTARDALSELLPTDFKLNSIRATLHFLDPNIEVNLSSSLLDVVVCSKAIDQATNLIASLDGSLNAEQFPPFPASHCRMCNFRDLCPAGRDWLRVAAARE